MGIKADMPAWEGAKMPCKKCLVAAGEEVVSEQPAEATRLTP